MNIKTNIRDLIVDAYFHQYADIADTKEKIEKKKPRYFFSKIQWVFICLSIVVLFILPKGFSPDFAGYAISGLSLFVGLFFTYVLMLFDKINSVDFSKYHMRTNVDNYPIGVRLKNYFNKITILSHYAILLSIVCIILLSLTLLFDDFLGTEVNVIKVVKEIRMQTTHEILKVIILLSYRSLIVYFLFDFMLITIYLVSSSYDHIISELNKIKLS